MQSVKSLRDMPEPLADAAQHIQWTDLYYPARGHNAERTDNSRTQYRPNWPDPIMERKVLFKYFFLQIEQTGLSANCGDQSGDKADRGKLYK